MVLLRIFFVISSANGKLLKKKKIIVTKRRKNKIHFRDLSEGFSAYDVLSTKTKNPYKTLGALITIFF